MDIERLYGLKKRTMTALLRARLLDTDDVVKYMEENPEWWNRRRPAEHIYGIGYLSAMDLIEALHNNGVISEENYQKKRLIGLRKHPINWVSPKKRKR